MSILTRRTVLAAMAALAMPFKAQAGEKAVPTIKIGLLAPITSQSKDMADLGERLRQAVTAAIEWNNARQDSLFKIELELEDTGNDGRQAHNCANDLVSKGVPFVIGYGTPTEKSAAPVYADASILDFSIANANVITQNNPSILRLVPDNSAYTCRAKELIKDGKNFAIVYEGDGEEAAAQMADYAAMTGYEKRAGDNYINVTESGRFQEGLITKLQSLFEKGEGQVFLSTGTTAASDIIKQSRGSRLHFIGLSSLIYPIMASAEDAIVGTEIVSVTPPDYSGVQADILEICKQRKVAIKDLEMIAFSGVVLMAAGLRGVYGNDVPTNPDPALVRQWLIKNPTQTPIGKIAYNEQGNFQEANLSRSVWQPDSVQRYAPQRVGDYPRVCAP